MRRRRVTEGATAVKADPEKREFAKRLRREMTRAEVIVWTRLKRRQLEGFQFRRQLPLGPYVVDFACPSARLVVEADGETHSTDEERAYDARRTAFLEAEGWRVLRFWNAEVFENEDGVVETIRHALIEQSEGR